MRGVQICANTNFYLLNKCRLSPPSEQRRLRMKQNFYTAARWNFVYLLLLEEENEDNAYFFVGRTHSSLSKIYSKHINGGYATTKETFTKTSRPKLYVLKDCQMTDAEAYRYVIAYIRFLNEYAVGESLNYDGSISQGKCLKSDTERIYREISQESLEDLLKRTYVVRAIDADRKRAAQKIQEAERVVQLNIAANENDKRAFDAYCKQLGLSRRHAFAAILDAATNKTSSQFERIISNKNQKIEKRQAVKEKGKKFLKNLKRVAELTMLKKL